MKPEMTNAEIAEFLSGCPILRGVKPELLEQLAQHMTPATYRPHKHLDDTWSKENPLRCLRAVVTGRLGYIVLTAGNEQRRLVGPGEFSGFESVQAHYGEADRTQHWACYVVDRCLVLELWPQDFDEALGDCGAPLVKRLMHGFSLSAWWPMVYPALRDSRLFGRIRRDAAWSMLSRGTIRTLKSQDMLFTPGEVKSVLLLKGLLVENPAWTNPNPEHVVRRGKKKKDPSVVAPDPEKDPSVVAPGSLVGFREMLRGEQPADPFKAITACDVLELTGDGFKDALTSIPSLSVRLRGLRLRARDEFKPRDIVVKFFDCCGHRTTIPLPSWSQEIRNELKKMNCQGYFLPQDKPRPDLPAVVRAVVFVDKASDWPEAAAKIPLPARRWALPVAVLQGPPRPRLGDPLSRVLSAIASGLEVNAADGAHATDHWPVGAVRAVVALPQDAERESIPGSHAMARVARALAYRRVGVAIGGSSVLSAAAIPLIQKMRKKNIPIDAVSGTSFGTLIGAFYTVLGQTGVNRMVNWMWTFTPTLLGTGSFTSWGIALWMRQFVGDVELGDVEIPLFPVATDSAALTEFDLRSGRVAQAVRISGSMPPGAPTYRDGRRLLDGGIVADVPCRVLDDEGVDLIVGVSSFAVPNRLPEPKKPFPLAALLGTADPHRRFVDFARSYLMLWHYAAYSQADYATVMYTGEDFGENGVDFAAAPRIVRKASKSAALKMALVEIEGAWDALNPSVDRIGASADGNAPA